MRESVPRASDLERIIVNYFECLGEADVVHEDDMWFLRLDGIDISLTALALALAQELRLAPPHPLTPGPHP